jgi:hypothetical protein
VRPTRRFELRFGKNFPGEEFESGVDERDASAVGRAVRRDSFLNGRFFVIKERRFLKVNLVECVSGDDVKTDLECVYGRLE